MHAWASIQRTVNYIEEHLGLVLEMNRKALDAPIDFIGVEGQFPFKMGKMLGERPGVNMPDKIWSEFFKVLKDIPCLSGGRLIGICYHGNAPDGYTTYFAGAEVEFSTSPQGEVSEAQSAENCRFTSWRLPAREYVVCGFEAESLEQLTTSALGKAMRYTRSWLKKHSLIADGFFPEIYYQDTSDAYMELWIPYKHR